MVKRKKDYIIINSLREIKCSLRRFMSLLIMSLLGVGVFVGLKSTAPSMIKTIDNYYDSHNTYDLKLVSTYGWGKEDISYFENYDFICDAEGEYQADSLCILNDSDLVIRSHSISEKINTIEVLEGRLPESDNEILVEKYLLSEENLSIGDKIVLDSSSLLKYDEYEIVGSVDSSLYIDPNIHKSRGVSSIGSGKVSYYTYLMDTSFTSSYYTNIYLTISEASSYVTSSSKYEKIISSALSEINEDKNVISEKRRNEIITDQEKVLDGYLPEGITSQDELTSLINTNESTLLYMESTMEHPETDADYLALKSANEQMKVLLNKYHETEEISAPTVLFQSRNDDSNYKGYIQDADSITNLSKIFPVVFYVIAVFISLVSMSRMVEDDRLQIGTLKSMGFSSKHVLAKYLIYSSLATFLGGVIGGAIFFVAIPEMIWNIYRILFDIPSFALTFEVSNFILGIGISLICICGMSLITALKNLRYKTAELLRPKAPKNGKRVFLERINFIWKRLKFSRKVTIRNIFRYKSRVFMTIFGVAGCTALLLSGFGLKDSITGIPSKQFRNVFNYDEMIYYKADGADEVNALLKDERISHYINTIYSSSYTASFSDKSVDVILCAGEQNETYRSIINLMDKTSKEKLTFEENKVIISDKMAQLLSVKAGDSIVLQGLDYSIHEYEISAVCEDYLYHYVFMSDVTYTNSIGEFKANVSFAKNKDGTDASEVMEDFLKNDNVLSIVEVDKLITDADNMLKSLNSVVIILIVLSGALSFVVMFNLSNINISERKREIATLKVLGFFDKEVDNYVLKENIFLTVIGIALGIVLGYFLNLLICSTVEIDMVRFLYCIKPLSYLYSVLLSFLFTFIVNIITHFILKKIDMIESLKSVE